MRTTGQVRSCWSARSDASQWKRSLAHLCALCGPRCLQCAPSLSQMGFLGVKVNQSVIVAGRGSQQNPRLGEAHLLIEFSVIL